MPSKPELLNNLASQAMESVLDLRLDDALTNSIDRLTDIDAVDRSPWLLCYQAMERRLSGSDHGPALRLAQAAQAHFTRSGDMDGHARAFIFGRRSPATTLANTPPRWPRSPLARRRNGPAAPPRWRWPHMSTRSASTHFWPPFTPPSKAYTRSIASRTPCAAPPGGSCYSATSRSRTIIRAGWLPRARP